MENVRDKILTNNLKSIIDHFGVNNQLKKFNEECYELIEAIKLYQEACFNSEGEIGDLMVLAKHKQNITEEIADCMVLLNQFIIYFKIDTGAVHTELIDKTNRTIKRIKEGYYETNK